MDFYLVLDRVIELLKERGRASYRALKLQFSLNEEQFAALRDELVNVHRVALDRDGIFVWAGQAPAAGAEGVTLAAEGERRQLTVMFCDLVDATALSARLDPEELRDLIRTYQAASGEIVARYDGWIAQHLGDGLLVYFGFPRAHEDAAYRAVCAAFGIVEGMGRLNSRLAAGGSARLAVRIGIDTGVVVVGEVGSGERIEQLALGEAPNVAARLQGLAEAGTVLLSAATYRLVRERVQAENLGARLLKGLERPVQVYRLLSDRAAGEPHGAAHDAEITPLVNREAEFALLQRSLDLAGQMHGQVVLLCGEPGIGKSRLVKALTAEATRQGHRRTVLRASAYSSDSAFHLITESLQAFLGLRPDAAPGKALARLERELEAAGQSLEDSVPPLAALLSIPLEGRYPSLELGPEERKRRTREALVAWLLAGTEHRPALIIGEDLHWADPSSLEVLKRLIEQAPGARIFIVLTARPEFQAPLGPSGTLTHLVLGPLEQKHARQLVEKVLGSSEVPAEVATHIAGATDGNPLFVEEMTKAMLDLGVLRGGEGRYEMARPLASVAIPATLRDSLMARLDRLGSAKAVAQFAAVIGRRFTRTLLRAAGPFDEATIERELARLVESGLVFQRGTGGDAFYLFKHALVQEGAYQSLLRRTRQQHHGRIARCLVESLPRLAASEPELVARHFTEAGLAAEAVPFWQRAGEKAMASAAFTEAVNHLTRARELIGSLPAGGARDRREFDILTALTRALWPVRGYAAPEVERAVERAYELGAREEDPGRKADLLQSQAVFYLVRARYATARDRAREILPLAAVRDRALTLLEAHSLLGMVAVFTADFTQADAHFRTALDNYDPAVHRAVAARFSSDMGVTSLAYRARALWFLGRADEALESAERALRLAESQRFPLSIAQAMGIYTHVLHQFHDDAQLTLEWCERTLAYATGHALPYWAALASIVKARIEAGQGDAVGGVARIRASLERYRATGAKLGFTWFMLMLAEAQLAAGAIAESMQVVREALALGQETGERYYEAELHRLTGELALAGAARDAGRAAEAAFLLSIEVARAQGALVWELRGTCSLARLWSGSQRREEAHRTLQEILARFGQGFASADVRAARVLLAELVPPA